ncbi:hypothetical protein CWB58_18555 [Pseudoalteromonas sp. S201]|jgi:hypothetical protein|uniref:hypothetical protein n=1 Tax=Pseudoalteromonas sp. S201 TaxID=579519 RepID=UPI00110D00BF|nr:hypothetical protein [Pseudoalteromonas sp. S201]TMS91611.1 hypothetical protein CWB58_18555 [Pseudoalteromonas sp. S201]
METNKTSRSLIKATILSFVVAMITLVLFILPAEYNIDPTGVGQKLGLTVFNDEKTKPLATQASDGEQDTAILTVPAGKGIEYKLDMKKFQKATYEWVTDGGELYVDLHGEPKGDTTGYFESYTIATTDEMKGSFTVPFDGSHGWYWKNTSEKDITIQLIFSGDYVIEGLK